MHRRGVRGIYDRYWYDALRGKYGAELLASVYDNVKPTSEAGRLVRDRAIDIRPLGGLCSVLKATQSLECFKSKSATR